MTPGESHTSPQAAQEEIRRGWRQNQRTGKWHPSPNILDAKLRLESPPQITKEVPGDGNCAYSAFKVAAQLHMSPNHIRQGTACYVQQHRQEFATLIQPTVTPSTRNEERLTVLDLEHAIITPGVYANEQALCALAWAFRRNIEIYDAMTGDQWLSIPEKPPWEPATASRSNPVVKLAFLRHRMYCIYDNSFSAVARADNNFWAIIPAPLNWEKSAPHRL